jgi:type I restriction enzyme, S subunit
MNSFSEISLKDAVSFVVDNRGRSVPVQDVGIPLISTACISNEELHPDLSTERYVSDEIYRNWFRSHPQPGDIILTNKGSKNGEIALVPDPVNFCIAQDMVALRANSNLISPAYLFAILRSRLVQLRIKALNVDAVIPHFKKTDFDKLLIPLPSRRDQDFIGRVYLDISKKIELNRKTNETLEAMAKALFKSWFVDFDPVKAKAEGRPTGLPAEISDLFPDSFEDSELGEIPSGWQCSPLADRAIYLSRGISPVYCEEGGVLVLNQKCVRDSRISFEKARRHDTTRKQIIGREVRRFDALVNSTGVGTLGRVAMMPICQEEVVVDSHVTVVRGSNEQESFFISSTLLNRQTEIEALGEGSTGQTELSRVVLGSVPVIFPSPQLISAYFDFAFIIQDKIEKNDQASVALASARDALLPKLISGEIRIPDAEGILEEVGI